MNNYCVDLNLPVSLLRPDYDPYSAPIGHTVLDNKYINYSFFDFIDKLNLKLLYVEVFVKDTTDPPGIHTDHGQSDMAKLNWVYGGTKSTMNWYEPLLNITKNDLIKYVSPINSDSIIYPLHTVKFLCSYKVGFPSIVQSGSPHNVMNWIDKRYCYSAVLLTKDNVRLTFSETVELFKDYWQGV